MALFLAALAKCDMPDCEYTEEVHVLLLPSDELTVFHTKNLKPPDDWEGVFTGGRRLWKCPECILGSKHITTGSKPKYLRLVEDGQENGKSNPGGSGERSGA